MGNCRSVCHLFIRECNADEIVDVSSLARITKATTEEFEVTFTGSDLPWGAETVVTLFAAARCLTSRMINYLMPEAAEKFYSCRL